MALSSINKIRILVIVAQLLSLSAAVGQPATTDSTRMKLFGSDEPFEITLSGNVKELLIDRAVVSQFHPMMLMYARDSVRLSIPVEMRTRGHFRKMKENCIYPPLLIHFLKNDNHLSSVFNEQVNLKLTMPCQGDEYVVNEYLVYKIYNLISPQSFRVRLVRVKMEDTKSKKVTGPFYGFLYEEHAQMASRNNQVPVVRKLIPEQISPESFIIMAVFEYLIGNTDWSVQYLQNIKLLADDSMAVPTAVPYDFDLAGIVDAPYAIPEEELRLSSVRVRRYRGYCITEMERFDSAIALFNRLKNQIYAIYSSCPLLSEKYKKSTAKYLDEFYATINNPKALQKEFGYPCNKNGTGNVVIKGLREE